LIGSFYYVKDHQLLGTSSQTSTAERGFPLNPILGNNPPVSVLQKIP